MKKKTIHSEIFYSWEVLILINLKCTENRVIQVEKEN